MAIAMVAMLAFGGTYAYFTASATARTATAKTGTLVLYDNNPVVINTAFAVPGDTILGAVNYTVTGTTVKSIVIVHYELDTDATGISVANPSSTVWKPVAKHDGYFYQIVNVNAAGEVQNFISEFVGEVKLTGSINNEQETSGEQKVPTGMGVDISLKLEAQSIQYRGLTYDTNKVTTEDTEEATAVAAAFASLTFATAA